MPQSRKRWPSKLHPRDKHKSYDIAVAGRRGLLEFIFKYVTHFCVHFACNLNTLKDRIAKQNNTKQATYKRKMKKMKMKVEVKQTERKTKKEGKGKRKEPKLGREKEK